MGPSVTKGRLTYLFIEGLTESIHGLVGTIDPKSLQDAIKKALRLEVTTTKNKTYSQSIPARSHKQPFDKDNLQPKASPPQSNEEESLRELPKKNVCFHCREPWKLSHQCSNKRQIRPPEAIIDDESKERY